MTDEEYFARLAEDIHQWNRIVEERANTHYISASTAQSHKNHVRTFERFVHGLYPPPQ
jgi:hypothetical protein